MPLRGRTSDAAERNDGGADSSVRKRLSLKENAARVAYGTLRRPYWLHDKSCL